jgi:hypothetical protein
MQKQVLVLVVWIFALLAPVTCKAEDTTTAIASLASLIERYDSSSCRECHQEIYTQWEKSHHSRPLMALSDRILMAAYLKEGELAIGPSGKATKANLPCAKCHLPQLGEATDEVASELAAAILKDDKDTVRKLSISCLVCHQEKAVIHHRYEADKLYSLKEIPEHDGKYKTVARSSVMSSPLFCGQCHGLGPVLETEHPIQCATLYGSYLHAYIPSGGTQTCQDCHMQNKDHTIWPDYRNREDTSARLASAFPMDVQVLDYTFQPVGAPRQPMVVIRTKITSNAGHRFPDG